MSKASFGERFGFIEPKIELEPGEMPDKLRNCLWSIIYHVFFERVEDYGRYDQDFEVLSMRLWLSLFKEPLDSRPRKPQDARDYIRREFFKGDFIYVYEFIELLLAGELDDKERNFFESGVNRFLEMEKAAFRLANGNFVQITENIELEALKLATSDRSPMPIREHIRSAAKHLSEPRPDFRNSVKESISAVEAAVSYVLNRKTSAVAKPLKVVAEHFDLHPKQIQAFESLYGWTSDDKGIRHRILEKSDVSHDDAKFMLVACSAFANYLVALRVRHGPKIY